MMQGITNNIVVHLLKKNIVVQKRKKKKKLLKLGYDLWVFSYRTITIGLLLIGIHVYCSGLDHMQVCLYQPSTPTRA
jgi:hypothetical protein